MHLITWEPKVAKIKHTRNENGKNFTHQNKTTLFWRKKAKINLHQNFPIYGNGPPTNIMWGYIGTYELKTKSIMDKLWYLLKLGI
jgi:hypothetical protein